MTKEADIMEKAANDPLFSEILIRLGEVGKERTALAKAAQAYRSLNAVYRSMPMTGKGPSEALMKRLDKANAVLKKYEAGK